MIIECPNCKQRYNVMNSSHGEIVTCQSCKNPITLPEIKDGKEVICQKKNLLQRIRDFGYSSDEIESNTSTISEAKTVEIPRVVRTDSICGNESKLISCPGCGRQVSPKAQACPSCGYPIASEFNRPKTVRIKVRMPGFIGKLSFEDKNGNILASGYNGDVVSFDVDDSTYVKGSGFGYGMFSDFFKVYAGKKYEAKLTGFFGASIRINEVDVIDSE